MDRRDFLKKGALTIAGAIVGGTVFSGLAGSAGCSSPPKNKRIGLQAYSLRDAMGQDPEGTLKAIAAMGYQDLELASYDGSKMYGYTPDEFRSLVNGLGMKVVSCHIGRGWEPEKEEEIMAWWNKAMDDHKAVGCKYVIIPALSIGGTKEELDVTCAYFNRLAAMAKDKGLRFGYHNHDFEFKEVDGQPAYDYLLQNTDKDVAFEMDVYWVKRGGYEPVDYFKKYPGRFPLLHIKDDSIIGNSGKIDFEEIFKGAYAQGLEDFFVEVEQYELPAEICVEKSFDYLNGAPFVKNK